MVTGGLVQGVGVWWYCKRCWSRVGHDQWDKLWVDTHTHAHSGIVLSINTGLHSQLSAPNTDHSIYMLYTPLCLQSLYSTKVALPTHPGHVYLLVLIWLYKSRMEKINTKSCPIHIVIINAQTFLSLTYKSYWYIIRYLLKQTSMTSQWFLIFK